MALPKIHILKEYANGVMDQRGKFYSYKTLSWSASGSLAARQNVRYYIAHINMSTGSDPAVGALVDKVEATVNRATTTISQLSMPVVAAAGQLSVAFNVPCGFLTDINTAVTITIASEQPLCIIKYAEVDELPGDYQG